MVDIYEMPPQGTGLHSSPNRHPPYANAGQDARMARYQTLLRRLSARDETAAVARVDWGSPDCEPIEMQKNEASTPAVRLQGAGALVGNFADAVAAMR